MIATTKKGTEVEVSFVPDVWPNKGGFYCEIADCEDYDVFDNFCIHPEDCDCSDDDALEAFAREYVSQIEEY